MEKGVWENTGLSPKEGPQLEIDSALSYPIPLCEGELVTVKYLNEAETAAPGSVPGCNGSPTEPSAEPGFLCVFTGSSDNGSKSINKNNVFVGFENADGGNAVTSSGSLMETGEGGVTVIFRSTEFNITTPVEKLSAAKSPVRMHWIGGWAISAK
jgi:hypothetical protein